MGPFFASEAKAVSIGAGTCEAELMKRGKDIVALFDELDDPRVQRTRRHRLTDVLMLVLIGTIVGCEGWDGIVSFARSGELELRRLLALPSGIPSADTLRRVMAAVDPKALERTLTAWTSSLYSLAGTQVAVDGKSVRGTLERETGEGALHLVNAWVCEHEMVLGQYATDVKSNEVTAIPKLLDLLAVEGATVTIDAMGCQRGIAKAIVEKGADYIFGLKSNQPTMHREVLEAFDEATCTALESDAHSYAVTADKGHGRSEQRRVWVQRDVHWLTRSEAWPKLSCLVMVESTRTRRGETSVERRAYISSRDASAETLGRLVRGHWHVENKLHWVLDVTFGEDRARLSRKNGAQNVATMRKLALNLLTRAPSLAGEPLSKPRKQQHARLSFAYLLCILTGGDPTGALPARRPMPRGSRAW